jgi:hypothetical protein
MRDTQCDQVGTWKLIREQSDSRVAQKRKLEQIVAIPATLYFPASIVDELNEMRNPRVHS